jgi:hypothetical protein
MAFSTAGWQAKQANSMVSRPGAHHGLVEIGLRLLQPVGLTVHRSSVAGVPTDWTDRRRIIGSLDWVSTCRGDQVQPSVG